MNTDAASVSLSPLPRRERPRAASAWKLWANPILRRYCRSRLRPVGLGVSLLMILLIAGFIFFMARSLGIYQADMEAIDAERWPIFPLLILQGVIVFLFGTGQTAAGMTAEADEGVIDYQRLAPMSPLAKLLGYLLGLPCREWILFAATLPFSWWAFWRGEVEWLVAAQVYGVFFCAALLYHSTGLVAGTVVKKRRWSFLISMGAVFLLYTVIPQAANFGLVYFQYLTVQPVIEDCLPYLLPREQGEIFKLGQQLFGKTRFFNLDFPAFVFTVLTQAVFLLTFGMIVWRRWRRAESHLFGKAWGVAFFAYIQIMLLGIALPLVDSGRIFPSVAISARYELLSAPGGWTPSVQEAIAMIALFGFVTLAMIWTLTATLTPSAERQMQGWRRARKLGRRRLFPGSDPATSFWWTAAMCALGTAGWWIFADHVLGSRWFPGQELSWRTVGAFAATLFGAGIGFQALLEGAGARRTALALILIGLAPIMVGSVIAAVGDVLIAPAAWIIGISPLSWPTYASGFAAVIPDLPADIARSAPRSFLFWNGVGLLVSTWLVRRLIAKRRAIARRAGDAAA